MKSTMTGTVPSSGRGGTAAAMTRNKQTAEEHSTLEQQPPGRLDHPAWWQNHTRQACTTVRNIVKVHCVLRLTDKIEEMVYVGEWRYALSNLSMTFPMRAI